MSITPSDTLERVESLPLNSVKRQKRATALTLTLMAAAPVVLLIWDPLYQQMRIVETNYGCGSILTEEQCKEVLAEVQKRNVQLAPSYERFEDCEREFVRLSRQCKIGEWCEPQALSTCLVNERGEAYPPAAGFMISEDLYQRLRQSEPIDWASVGGEELQPVYTLGNDENHYGYSISSHTYVPSAGYAGSKGGSGYYNHQGQYLAYSNTQLDLNRKFLADSKRLHHPANSSSGLPSRYYASGSVSRGGFGNTARATAASVSS